MGFGFGPGADMMKAYKENRQLLSQKGRFKAKAAR